MNMGGAQLLEEEPDHLIYWTYRLQHLSLQ
jgi:hypothetical protein